VNDYSRSHLSDGALLEQARSHHGHARTATAALLADLAEIETRRLYEASCYPTMRAWCVGELKMSEDALTDRLTAARTAREYPAIFPMLADGRLHLTAVLMLAKHLNPTNAHELLESAAGKSKSELADLLACWFPTTESLPMVMALPGSTTASAPGTPTVPERYVGSTHPTEMSESMPATPITVIPHPKVAPVARGRHLFQFMGDDSDRELLREVQDLMGPAADSSIGAVFFRGLRELKTKLEKRKHALTDRPRTSTPPLDPRNIPAAVRRTVHARDGGRCAFVGVDGRRCGSRRGLQYDHIIPIARGGDSSVPNVRQLCSRHNQIAADRVFGRSFMEGKREQARARSRRGAA